VVVTISGAGFTTIWNDPEAVTCLESVTVAVNENVPTVVGVPVIEPPGLKFKPGGSPPPVTAQEYGVVPPVAPRFVVG